MNPQMKYKMIVLNLDGTLTNDNKEITGETVFNQVLEPSLFPLLHKENSCSDFINYKVIFLQTLSHFKLQCNFSMR